MATVNGSRELVSAGADFKAGDWARLGAEASLDLLAVADLNRGIDLGLGVEALARLDGSVKKFIAADVHGQAHAAARVRAQVQVPLDLFNEAGIAVRLQAVAEAAAGVQLGIGLSIDDFLALAGGDERLRGVPLELLKVFLDEFEIQGGVMAKVAVAAMAYANLAATGSFVKSRDRQPGFTIAAEAGIGLKAGAGFRVFARFGVDDPRRLVRRTIDVAVDETLAAISASLPAESRSLVEEASAPLKMAFRCAFELGTALSENKGAFAANSGEQLALRLLQVGLEEVQRFVFGRVVEFASDQLLAALRGIAASDSVWAKTLARRQALTDRLKALPEEPFEATDANRTYWLGVITEAIDLASALNGGGALPPSVAEPLAITWCGAQLLMKSVERISSAKARVSVIGVSPKGATAAFSGTLPPAPAGLKDHINTVLGRGAGDIGQAQAIDYLLRVTGDQIEKISPAAGTVISLLAGNNLSPAEGLSLVLSNMGAFARGPNEKVSAEAALGLLRKGLQDYINSRLDKKLVPLIDAATADKPEIRIYLNEVLLSTLHSTVDTVFDTVLQWKDGDQATQRALREMCSGLLMRLFGRSLVVTGDVLLAHSMENIRAELLRFAAESNGTGGISPKLAEMTGLERELVADIVTETLEVCADTFTPMTPARRAQMRDLMYRTIDSMPPKANRSTLEALKAAGMFGNADAAIQLAQMLGDEIAGNLIRFIEALLSRVAASSLELLGDAIGDIQKAVQSWLTEVEDLARELAGRITDLAREIGELQERLDDAADALLLQASAMLGGFAEDGASRDSLREKIKDQASAQALANLAEAPGYGLLPKETRGRLNDTAGELVDNALDGAIFEPVIDALLAVSAETAELLDDLRAIEPGDDLAEVIKVIVLDRIEATLRKAFGRDPSFEISFDAPVIGKVSFEISLPTDTLISAMRTAIGGLENFNGALNTVVGQFTSVLDIERDLEAAKNEYSASTAAKEDADQRIAESGNALLDLTIVSPKHGSAVETPVKMELHVSGGTQALLNNEGLSHRRLFVWVNENELSLEGAHTDVRKTGAEALIVEVEIPLSMLHEGINAIACVLVPGDDQRRIERVLSFLCAPAAKPAGGKDRTEEGLLKLPGNTWVKGTPERKKSLAAARADLKKELAATAAQHEKARKEIAKGAPR